MWPELRVWPDIGELVRQGKQRDGQCEEQQRAWEQAPEQLGERRGRRTKDFGREEQGLLVQAQPMTPRRQGREQGLAQAGQQQAVWQMICMQP